MARKGWSSLSPKYRARLESKGVSRADYEGGTPIQAARGHEHTPERPTASNATQFPQYAQARGSLIKKLTDKKERIWGDSPRWTRDAAMNNIRRKPPSMAQLRWAVNDASDEEIIDALREDPDVFRWLGYH